MEIMSHVPAGTIIIGEIYYPGKESKDVTPIMGSLPEKAIERQNGEFGPLHYYIHDMIYYNGKNLMDLGAAVRYDLLCKVVEKYDLNGYDVNGEYVIDLAERFDNDLMAFIEDTLASGEEGVVLKKKTAPYTPGKRPVWDTIKVKKTDGCDAVIMGFCSPTMQYTGKDPANWPYWAKQTLNVVMNDDSDVGELALEVTRVPVGDPHDHAYANESYIPVTMPWYYDWPTAIRVGAFDENGELVEIGTIASGLTQDLMRAFKESPLDYIGRVCELQGMEKHNEDHTLRHFFFKGFRPDKSPDECTLVSIFGA
jgi:ATP-dependent DNA ligase